MVALACGMLWVVVRCVADVQAGLRFVGLVGVADAVNGAVGAAAGFRCLCFADVQILPVATGFAGWGCGFAANGGRWCWSRSLEGGRTLFAEIRLNWLVYLR